MAASDGPAPLTDIVLLPPLRRGADRRRRRLSLRAVRAALYPLFGRIPCLRRRSGAVADDLAAAARRLHVAASSRACRSCSARRRRADLLPRTRQRLLRIAHGFAQQLDAVDVAVRAARRGRGRAGPRRRSPAGPSRAAAADPRMLRARLPRLGVGRARVRADARLRQAAGAAGPRSRRDLRRRRGAARGRRSPGVRAGAHARARRQPAAVPDRGQAARRRDRRPAGVSRSTRTPTRSSSCPPPRARRSRVRDGFSFMFADALRPPIPAGSLDAVVTSWFIDVARADLRQTAAAINRVLRPGGLWVNLGPLRFQSVLSRAYTIEEVHEIVAGSAFELPSHDRQELPYFDSPVSGSRRTRHRVSLRRAQDGRGAAPSTSPTRCRPGSRTRSRRFRSRRRWSRSAARRCSRPACCR